MTYDLLLVETEGLSCNEMRGKRVEKDVFINGKTKDSRE